MDDEIDSYQYDGSSAKETENFLSFSSRLNEIEAEADKLLTLKESCKEAINDNNSSMEFSDSTALKSSQATDIDSRSIYVGNVDYSSTANEIEQHFSIFGKVNRVTIQCDKFSRKPKGFCYVEFAEVDSVENSLSLADTLFKGRLLKVLPKRTNIPGISSTNRGSRGRSRGRIHRGRGRFTRYHRHRRGPY